jgi:aminoglycoside 6-adenylyltransferase
MRTEQEMYEVILNIARNDERIRVVILNGSRANPNVQSDIFQDFDIVYIVTDVSSFKNDPVWIKQFGELMMMQLPEDMQAPPPMDNGNYAYLMQFADGNRIDLTLHPISNLDELERDSLSILLLDKDGILEPFPPSNESDYLPQPPTPKAFDDCCNEFWWVSTYVAKGLWREEITYAKHMLDQYVRDQLMKMLAWHIGIKTQFSSNPGKFGKHFKQYLEPKLWDMLMETYSDAEYDHTWGALDNMCQLFRVTALSVADKFGYDYPHLDDEKVSAHLKHVRLLPRNAKEMY